MSAPVLIDADVLLYSISTDPADSRRRDLARALLDRDDLVLSVQVLQEFYVQATRATRPDALPHDLAAGLVRTWLRFRVQETTLAVLLGIVQQASCTPQGGASPACGSCAASSPSACCNSACARLA